MAGSLPRAHKKPDYKRVLMISFSIHSSLIFIPTENSVLELVFVYLVKGGLPLNLHMTVYVVMFMHTMWCACACGYSSIWGNCKQCIWIRAQLWLLYIQIWLPFKNASLQLTDGHWEQHWLGHGVVMLQFPFNFYTLKTREAPKGSKKKKETALSTNQSHSLLASPAHTHSVYLTRCWVIPSKRMVGCTCVSHVDCCSVYLLYTEIHKPT